MAKNDWKLLLKRNGNPVIEDDNATICWQGKNPPDLICDLNDWDLVKPFKLTSLGSNLWGYSLNLTSDAYIEYAFVREGERIPDPVNPKITPNGMGKFNNFFFMPEGKPTTLTRRGKHVAHGKIITNVLDPEELLAGSSRKVRYYQPPVDYPVPLVVVFDGGDYFKRAHLPVMVDNLIAAKRIQPLALAMLENGRQYRTMEYACSEATLGFLQAVLLPDAMQKLNILDYRKVTRSYGVIGASLGGLMAFFTALRLPHIFGKVLSQSGAFSIADIDFVVWDLVRYFQPLPFKIWMDCGIYESLLEPNRRMAALLKEKKSDFQYDEFHAGHNYPAWRDHIANGLEHLFSYKP